MRCRVEIPAEALVHLTISAKEAQMLMAICHHGKAACAAVRGDYPGLPKNAERMMEQITEMIRPCVQVFETGYGAYENYK